MHFTVSYFFKSRLTCYDKGMSHTLRGNGALFTSDIL